MAKRGLVKQIDKMGGFLSAIDVLAGTRVMVGVPADNDERDDGEITNAEIGWLMENGIPEQNVPARPHMVPGVKRAKSKISDYMKQAGRLAMEGKTDSVVKALHAAGTTAVSSIKQVIREGIPPPLADSTIRGRSRGRKGAQKELARRAAGKAPGVDLVKPLINTGQYLNSITHVLRRVSKPARKKKV